MWHHAFRYAFGLALILALYLPASAQQPPDKEPPKKEEPAKNEKEKTPEDYPYFFNKPETIPEFWTALNYELSVGRPEIAANMLQGMLDLKPTKEQLLEIAEKEGMSAFLRLRLVQRWSPDLAKDRRAKQNVGELISQATTARKEYLTDPIRIGLFLKNLTGSPEEQSYAQRQLYEAGDAVIPLLVDRLRQATGENRLALLAVLPRLKPETVPPLLATLDSNDPNLKADVIEAIRKRADKRMVPYLWYLAGGPNQTELVRKAAVGALAYLLELDPDRLPIPKAALTREAERYYRHQVVFLDAKLDPKKTDVAIWRWDPEGQKIVLGWPSVPMVSPSRAEEYYCHRYASQALEIDPTYEPAQVVLLSMLLDKTTDQVGLDTPLSRAKSDQAAKVNRLLTTVNPDLVADVLDHAISEKRLNVVLAAVRALGDLADVRATRPTVHGRPALVRALEYPERRVQMAAAESLLRIPGGPVSGTPVRILEILRGAIASQAQPQPGAKVLIGYFNDSLAKAVAHAVQIGGYEPVIVHSGREALRRLADANDIDVLVLDSELPDPLLSSWLAQLRTDPRMRGLPLILAVSGERDETVQKLSKRYREESEHLDAVRRREETARKAKDEEGLKGAQEEARKLEDAIADLSRRYAVAVEGLEMKLRRYAEQYPNTWVVSPDLPLDAKRLKVVLVEHTAQSESPPLGEVQRKEYAEQALVWLARMAKGELTGFDVRTSPEIMDAVLGVLQSNTYGGRAVEAALEIAGRLPGPRPQRRLAGYLLDGNHPEALRVVAARELLRHMQEHSVLLVGAEIESLVQLVLGTEDKSPLKPHLTVLIGTLRPDAALTGERLKTYQPPPPVAPAPKP